MRIGIVDLFSPFYCRGKWVAEAASRLGHDVVRIRHPVRLEEFRGDLVLFLQHCQVPFDELWDIARRSKGMTPWVAWMFDLLGHGIRDRLLEMFPWGVFDHVFCKTPELLGDHLRGIYQSDTLPDYVSPPPRVSWMDQGCPAWEPIGWPRPHDVLVVGRRTDRRQRLVNACRSAGLSVVIAGRGWADRQAIGEVDGDMRSGLFACAKVVLSDNDPDGVPKYWSDRAWLSLASGTPYVGQRVPGFGKLGGVLWWDDEPEAIDLCLACRSQDAWTQLHESACRTAELNRYDHRVESILKTVFPGVREPCLSLA